MGKSDDWFIRNGKNPRNSDLFGGEIPYYEDAHSGRGEYSGQQEPSGGQSEPQKNYSQQGFFSYTAPPSMSVGKAAEPSGGYAPPRNYRNVVVYAPKNPDDVQRLIDYMKMREPAIVNLDGTDEETAQRILDFVCGAIYALNGSVHRITSNIFLLSPEGVEITVPYDPKGEY